jgi:hypothetical protein
VHRWKRYKELYDEQEDLKASGVLLQTIAKALGSATNISRIVYSPSERLIPLERKTVRDLVPRDHRTDVPGRYARDNVTQKNHPFRQLIGGIYAAQYTGVRELQVAPFNEDYQGIPFTFDLLHCPNPELDLKAGQFMFQHLEKCELNIKVRPMANNMPGLILGTQRVVHLGSLIGVARDLQHLALHVSGWGPGHHHFHIGNAQLEQLKFNRLGLETTWPRLRSLSLEGLHANESDFLDLLIRHKDTLRMMSLRNCSLFTGSWANIVDEALCYPRILPFTLSSVNELQVPSNPGILVSSAGLDEWRYDGCIEVSEDGERTFVSSDVIAFMWTSLKISGGPRSNEEIGILAALVICLEPPTYGPALSGRPPSRVLLQDAGARFADRKRFQHDINQCKISAAC